jgi:hypothetical protein
VQRPICYTVDARRTLAPVGRQNNNQLTKCAPEACSTVRTNDTRLQQQDRICQNYMGY